MLSQHSVIPQLQQFTSKPQAQIALFCSNKYPGNSATNFCYHLALILLYCNNYLMTSTEALNPVISSSSLQQNPFFLSKQLKVTRGCLGLLSLLTNEGLDLLLCMLICSCRVWEEDVAWLSRLLPQLGLAVSHNKAKEGVAFLA